MLYNGGEGVGGGVDGVNTSAKQMPPMVSHHRSQSINLLVCFLRGRGRRRPGWRLTCCCCCNIFMLTFLLIWLFLVFLVFISLFLLMEDSLSIHRKLALVVEDKKMEVFFCICLFFFCGNFSVDTFFCIY